MTLEVHYNPMFSCLSDNTSFTGRQPLEEKRAKTDFLQCARMKSLPTDQLHSLCQFLHILKDGDCDCCISVDHCFLVPVTWDLPQVCQELGKKLPFHVLHMDAV